MSWASIMDQTDIIKMTDTQHTQLREFAEQIRCRKRTNADSFAKITNFLVGAAPATYRLEVFRHERMPNNGTQHYWMAKFPLIPGNGERRHTYFDLTEDLPVKELLIALVKQFESLIDASNTAHMPDLEWKTFTLSTAFNTIKPKPQEQGEKHNHAYKNRFPRTDRKQYQHYEQHRAVKQHYGKNSNSQHYSPARTTPVQRELHQGEKPQVHQRDTAQMRVDILDEVDLSDINVEDELINIA